MIKKRTRKWFVKVSHLEKEKIAQAESLARELGLHTATAQLLINRGCDTPKSAADFINKNSERFYDPFLMRDMDRACDKIIEILNTSGRIVIYGDYDVDGVTSVSSLYLYLKSLGANVDYYIPSRLSEGYGMSEASVNRLADEGTTLIITVDTGITSVDEAKLICDRGLDLIITDHHECHGELPCAHAVINPKRIDCEYPFKDLAGVGVVFKLISALHIKLHPEMSFVDAVRQVCEMCIDLVALGTIADVMPLKDENRLIVSAGLRAMEKRPRMPLECLLRAAGGDNKNASKRKITSGFVGFTLSPRINAAGRIKDASIAVELFLSEDEEKATALAEELCDINVERQKEENAIVEEAFEKIQREHDFAHDPVIVLDHETWHHGIIGIVASRITERYGRPCILVSFDEIGNATGDGSLGKGSGRSVKGMNLVNALSHCDDLLVKYGGHELAAGLTIERCNLEAFKQRINDYARGCFDGEEPEIGLEADYEMLSEEVSMEQALELYKLEPFGVSNNVPVFVMYDMTLSNISSVGQGKHSKLILAKDNLVVCGMCFRKSPDDLNLIPGEAVDVMFNLDINEYQNNKSLQFIVKDIRPMKEQLEREISEQRLYHNIKDGKCDISTFSDAEKESIIPSRCDFAAVYNIVKKEIRLGHDTLSVRKIIYLLSQNGINIRYVKLNYIIAVFREMNILGVDLLDEANEIYKFSYIFVKNKADLDKSTILKKLKSSSVQKSGV